MTLREFKASFLKIFHQEGGLSSGLVEMCELFMRQYCFQMRCSYCYLLSS